MRKLTPSIPLLLAVAVIGCGGGGSSQGSSTPLTSTGTNSTTASTGTTGVGDGSTTGANGADKYVGTWSGTYATQNVGFGDRRGTLTLRIRRANASDAFVIVTGEATDATQGAATVIGRIADLNPAAGSSLTMTYSSGFSDVYKGAPTIAENGHLVGPIGRDLVDYSIPTDLDLAPVIP